MIAKFTHFPHAAGGTILGMIFYGESKDWRRIVFITMILGAAVGLKLVS